MIFILKQCYIFCLEASVGTVPKRAINAKKVVGIVLQEEGLDWRVPCGRAESEGVPFNQVTPRLSSCRYIRVRKTFFVKRNFSNPPGRQDMRYFSKKEA